MLKNENITCYKRLNIDFKNGEAPDRIEFIRPDHCVDVVYPFMYQPINILYDEHGYFGRKTAGIASLDTLPTYVENTKQLHIKPIKKSMIQLLMFYLLIITDMFRSAKRTISTLHILIKLHSFLLV